MSLIFDVLSAINNPNQQASVSSLGSIVNTVSQLAGNQGLNPATTQSAFSVVGNLARTALKQQQTTAGMGGLESMIGQLAGGSASGAALQSLIPAGLQQQAVQTISSATGVSPTIVQGMLPGLITAAMGMLNLGAPKPGTRGGNPLLAAFLSGDEKSTDLGETLKFASRFLNPPR
ncbi:DUF937 domain-containing protein [Thermoleptolyngbya oregonensis NK1-22]|uniref:DUF937 domain-containing protein n=1 Tax=Thermoleptolyngbya oregonensis NK1-22 TaxID=2547457 RepID=A0AA96Y110_9CYAN|nr:hypothetical protein [Thermoleptolyngbya oregonensis]WOB42242.1 DUF937 domain-containing protein [Thermoleptolyngbya oregonensis NK1-22]